MDHRDFHDQLSILKLLQLVEMELCRTLTSIAEWKHQQKQITRIVTRSHSKGNHWAAVRPRRDLFGQRNGQRGMQRYLDQQPARSKPFAPECYVQRVLEGSDNRWSESFCFCARNWERPVHDHCCVLMDMVKRYALQRRCRGLQRRKLWG